jgi:hypothetical protein
MFYLSSKKVFTVFKKGVIFGLGILNWRSGERSARGRQASPRRDPEQRHRIFAVSAQPRGRLNHTMLMREILGKGDRGHPLRPLGTSPKCTFRDLLLQRRVRAFGGGREGVLRTESLVTWRACAC